MQAPIPMIDKVNIRINGHEHTVNVGTVLAAAIALAGSTRFRRSPSGQPRGPLCGMGICMECRVTVNGREHVRSCMTECAQGMEVRTDV